MRPVGGEADDEVDVPVFGAPIDGLVYSQRDESPELRWRETMRRPKAKPAAALPVDPRARDAAGPWEPGPRIAPKAPRERSRVREAALPVSLGLITLTFVGGLIYLFLGLYGYV